MNVGYYYCLPIVNAKHTLLTPNVASTLNRTVQAARAQKHIRNNHDEDDELYICRKLGTGYFRKIE
jgi:hypothetical protein